MVKGNSFETVLEKSVPGRKIKRQLHGGTHEFGLFEKRKRSRKSAVEQVLREVGRTRP